MNLHAARALLPEGWARDVRVAIDASGRIAAVTAGSQPEAGDERIHGFLVPGMPNVHSHAFQRAMAGLTEARTHASDSFWTWRELMYRFAARITPEQVADIAAWLYVEMLKAGFTSVAEFHYLHHDVAGRAFEDRAEMSHRIIGAAGSAGIALTHLPVLYRYSGFGSKPALPAQARFVQSTAEYLALVESLHARYDASGDVRIGAAFHSLRAIDPASLQEALAALHAHPQPVHIHVAEQRKEVDDCIAWSGRRPVHWLLENARPDARWCLVHATHVDEAEMGALAASGVVAGLCPTTEANLGDGIFPAPAYLSRQGRFGIGSDSHVEVSVAAELRLLEYGQRLGLGRRSVLASSTQPSPGQHLYVEACRGGAAALGIDAGRIAAGCRADLVALDAEHPALWNKADAQVMDAWIFAGDSSCVRDVMTGGAWRIRARRHAREEQLARRYRAAQAALLA